MISEFTNKDYFDVLEIIESFKDEDFYFTFNNQRIYINNLDSLKKLIKESNNIYYENSSIGRGIILLWKSFGGEKQRNYIKILCDNNNTARRLLTHLIWNFSKPLYIKIQKNSKFMPVLKEKGFHFVGGRGTQILLEKTNIMEKINVVFNNKN
jgi:hypothetical protein